MLQFVLPLLSAPLSRELNLFDLNTPKQKKRVEMGTALDNTGNPDVSLSSLLSTAKGQSRAFNIKDQRSVFRDQRPRGIAFK